MSKSLESFLVPDLDFKNLTLCSQLNLIHCKSNNDKNLEQVFDIHTKKSKEGQ